MPNRNRNEIQWRHNWSAGGVQIALLKNGKTLPRSRWEPVRPSASRSAAMLGMAAEGSALHLTAPQLAALNDYDAMHLGLPLRMDAVVHLHAEGRIDSKHFRLTIALEPAQTAHPWINYTRDGARIFVGERIFRLNPVQLEIMEIAERIRAATDVALRLSLFPQLLRLLRVPREARILATGSFGHISVGPLDDFQLERPLYTRHEGKLLPLIALPQARWAMAPHRHYYLRNS